MTVDLLPPDRPTQPKRPAPLQPRGLEESRRFERVMRSVAQAKEDQKTLQEKSDISDANAVLEPVDESADRGDATAQGVEGETVVAVEAEGGTESEAVVDGSATGVAETPLEVLIEAPVVTLEHLELKSGEALVSASSGAAFLASVVQSNSLPGVSAALTAGGKPVATDLFTKEEGEPLAALVPEGEPGASVYAQLATSTAEPEASAVRAAVTGVASVGAEGGVQLAGAPAAIALNGGFVPVLEALPVDLSTVQGTRQIEQLALRTIQTALRNGDTRVIQINLHPEGMGLMRLRAEQRDGQIHLRLEVEQADARLVVAELAPLLEGQIGRRLDQRIQVDVSQGFDFEREAEAFADSQESSEGFEESVNSEESEFNEQGVDAAVASERTQLNAGHGGMHLVA